MAVEDAAGDREHAGVWDGHKGLARVSAGAKRGNPGDWRRDSARLRRCCRAIPGSQGKKAQVFGRTAHLGRFPCLGVLPQQGLKRRLRHTLAERRSA